MSIILSAIGISKSFVLSTQDRFLSSKYFWRRSTSPSRMVAITALDFELNEGEIVIVKGANGSGKTTLLRILAGLLNSDGGEVRCDRKSIPLMSAGTLMHPELSISDNIEHALLYLGVSDCSHQKIDSILTSSNLLEFRNESPRALSKGMLVRLMLNIGLSIDSGVFLIDELLDELDEANRLHFVSRIVELAKGGRSFVISSHMINTVELPGRARVLEL